jgi:hypothetical protein
VDSLSSLARRVLVSRPADTPDPGRDHPGKVRDIARPSLVGQVVIRTRFLALNRIARHTHGVLTGFGLPMSRSARGPSISNHGVRVCTASILFVQITSWIWLDLPPTFMRTGAPNENIAMKRCAQCHGKLGLGVRSRNVWSGRWWVHVLYCSAHCKALCARCGWQGVIARNSPQS